MHSLQHLLLLQDEEELQLSHICWYKIKIRWVHNAIPEMSADVRIKLFKIVGVLRMGGINVVHFSRDESRKLDDIMASSALFFVSNFVVPP